MGFFSSLGKSLKKIFVEEPIRAVTGIVKAPLDIVGGLGKPGGDIFTPQAPDLSGTSTVMTGEITRARLDMIERLKRVTDSRGKSRITLPTIFGDGQSIL